MTTLYLTESHAYVSKRGATLRVKVGDESQTLPLAQISEVLCCGDISWSGAALRELADERISVAYVGPRGEWVGRWEPAESKAIPLRRAQFRAADDPARALPIARSIVAGKLRNCRGLLLRAVREGMLDDRGEAAQLLELNKRAQAATSIDRARGLEGEGAATYFAAFGRLVGRDGFTFTHRVRRPPSDPVNAMLSFGYALLTTAVGTALRSVGFDAHVGYLHQERYGRESLSLDLVEEFRPIIVDALVVAMLHRRMVTPADFEQDATACWMDAAARKLFIGQFARKLETEISHPVLGQRVTHRRAIELQARLLAKHLLGELPAYVTFSKR